MGRNKRFQLHGSKPGIRDQSYKRFHGQSYRRIPTPCSSNRNITQDECTDKEEIPGFFFDLETKSYFRITPENKKYYAEKKLKYQQKKPTLNTRDFKSLRRHPRYQCKTMSSLTTEIVDSQYQNISYESFRKNILGARLKMIKEVRRSKIHTETTLHCQTMVGNPDKGCVIGAWTASDLIGTLIHNHCLKTVSEDDESHQQQSSVVNFHFAHAMTDMCVAKVRDGLEFVLYVGNKTLPSGQAVGDQSSMHLYPIRSLCDLSLQSELDEKTLNLVSESALWSCAWNQNVQKIALGCEGSVTLVSVQNEASNHEAGLTTTRENVFALEFNKSGSLLYCGTNKGNLKYFDLRCNKLVQNMKLNRGLAYVKLLGSEEHVIASCYDHKLVQVDLRNQKIVVEYSDHNNEHLKLPFSFSEENGFLCSVGQDRFTRIWNLNRGNLLTSIAPTSESSCHPYAWFSEEWCFGTGTPETALVINTGNEFITYKP